MPAVKIMPAQTARQFVLTNVGATLPVRDEVDTRIVKQVATGKIDYKEGVKVPEKQFEHRRMALDSYKLGIITDVSQVGGYPDYKGAPYKDSDSDGIPDAWETAHGLNPKNASDSPAIAKNSGGYSNIEVYLNSLAAKGEKSITAAK